MNYKEDTANQQLKISRTPADYVLVAARWYLYTTIYTSIMCFFVMGSNPDMTTARNIRQRTYSISNKMAMVISFAQMSVLLRKGAKERYAVQV